MFIWSTSTNTHPHRQAEDKEFTLEIIYSQMDKVRARDHLWNSSYKYPDSRMLKITIMEEISKNFYFAHGIVVYLCNINN